MGDLTSALSSAMHLIGLARIAIDARDSAKAKGALMELTQKLNDVSISALASTEKAMSLQWALNEALEEARKLKARAEERERYSLAEVCPGSWAYASLATQEGAGTPAQFLCQPCFDKGVKRILRQVRASMGHHEHWLCPEGSTAHQITKHGTQIPMPAPGRRTTGL